MKAWSLTNITSTADHL